MEYQFSPPTNEDDFERFCERMLCDLWPDSEPQRYGRRGQRQHGVDIVDQSGLEPLRCAQCKWKGIGQFLEPDELEDEVTKALGFAPPIGKYFVLTTAPRSTELQKKLIELNQAHRKASKFAIVLYTWDRIEEYLRENPGAWDRYIDPPVSRAVEPLRNDVQQLVRQVDHLSVAVGAGEIGQKLEQVFQLLDKWDFRAAEIVLRQLETNHWSALSDDQRFLLFTYHGKCAWQSGKWHEAGKRYQEAKKFQPDSERALINEAHGYELQADGARAHALARALVTRFPATARLWALLIRTANAEQSLESLEKEIPSDVAGESEVAAALAMHAQGERKWGDAERLAKVAVLGDPSWSTAKILLGQAKAHQLVAGGWITVDEPLATDDLVAVNETLALFDQAVELARKTTPRATADALVERGRAKSILQDGAQDADFEEALFLVPDDASVLLRCGEHYLFSRRVAIALPLLRKHRSATDSSYSAFLLGLALREADYEGNLVEWLPLMRSAALDGAAPFQIQAISTVVGHYCRNGETKEASRVVDEMQSTSTIKDCCRVWIAVAEDRQADAKPAAQSALDSLDENTPIDVRKLVADALMRVEEYQKAIVLLEQIAVERREIHVALEIVRAAMKIQDVACVRRICREWRNAGILEPDLIDAELGVLERFAPREAFELLKELVAKLPDDKVVRFRLARLAVELDEAPFICRDVDSLPAPSEPSVQLGVEMTCYLIDIQEFAAAIRFGYEFLRQHQAEAAAHHVLAYAVIGSQPPEDALEIPAVIADGAAFTFVEEGSEQSRSYVISNGEDPTFPDDLDIAHGLAKRVLGLKAGDGFLISGDSLDGRKATITDVTSKYIHRARLALANWELMFPDSPAIESIRMGEPKGEPGKEIPDFTPMVRRVHGRQRQIDEQLLKYQQNLATIQLLAGSIGQNPFEVLGWLAASDTRGVRCADGSLKTFHEAIQLIASSPRIVLDIVSIATLDLVGLLESVLASPLSFVVTSNTIQELRAVREARRDRGTHSGYLSPSETGLGLAFKEVPPEASAAALQRIEELLGVVLARAECVDVPEVIELHREKRDQASNMLGLHGLETALLAERRGWALMTDDLAVGAVSEYLFGARNRVWTQPLLAFLASNGHISIPEFHSATAKLVAYGFTGIHLDADSLIAAAELGEWNPTHWPLKGCLDALGTFGDPAATVVVAARFIRRVLTKSLRLSNDALVVMALLDRVADSELGMAAVNTIERRADAIFGLNVQAAYEARRIIKEWRSLRGE